ncbi:unnamed protein product [Didymodactylos carnosus]|uniref:Uncharacterized protein n=2 Tax=Didymodactylos carnosus TaxID=1234261 RepID=A0A8S2ELR1_9BILA|nr:unnamed protein product [Didymodactylos carnosus]CAF3991888.1 unnamed protein product [Didymodactylos carnosus]
MPRTHFKKGQGSRHSNENFQNALVEKTTVFVLRSENTTLQIHYSSQADLRDAGRLTHSTDLEEMLLISAITVLQEWGEAITIKQLIKMVTYYVQELGKNWKTNCRTTFAMLTTGECPHSIRQHPQDMSLSIHWSAHPVAAKNTK